MGSESEFGPVAGFGSVLQNSEIVEVRREIYSRIFGVFVMCAPRREDDTGDFIVALGLLCPDERTTTMSFNMVYGL